MLSKYGGGVKIPPADANIAFLITFPASFVTVWLFCLFSSVRPLVVLIRVTFGSFLKSSS